MTNRSINILIFLFIQLSFGYSQITHGEILFERKTNLLKKYKTLINKDGSEVKK